MRSKHSKQKSFKRVGAFVIVPLLFTFFGYLIIYVIGAPVINFTTSAIELISLTDKPSFEEIGVNLLDEKKESSSSSSDEFVNQELASSTLNYPSNGDQYGRVIAEKVGINEPLFYGDSDAILSMGSGQYIGSVIPGDLGTTLIGGHNMPSFGKIYYLEIGDQFIIQTHYGDYTYQVTENRIANYQDAEIVAKLGDYSKRSVVLYTCYPLDAIGSTPDRVFISADYVSGPIINNEI